MTLYYVKTSGGLSPRVDDDLVLALHKGDHKFYEFSDSEVVALIRMCRAGIEDPGDDPLYQGCPVLVFYNSYD